MSNINTYLTSLKYMLYETSNDFDDVWKEYIATAVELVADATGDKNPSVNLVCLVARDLIEVNELRPMTMLRLTQASYKRQKGERHGK